MLRDWGLTRESLPTGDSPLSDAPFPGPPRSTQEADLHEKEGPQCPGPNEIRRGFRPRLDQLLRGGS